jgi:SAM-dependent methyltransferase
VATIHDIASRYDTDKAASRGYLDDFEEVFAPIRGRPTAILELGVLTGGSLRLWTDYFAAGPVVGLDRAPPRLDDPSGRIRVYRGSQDDLQLLDRIAAEQAPDGFDIVVDDCAHIGEVARTTFWHLFDRHLRPGGIYVIEDWGTGYWDQWPDGHRLNAQHGGARRRLYRRLLPLSHGWPGRQRATRRAVHVLLNAARPRRLASHDYGMVGFVKQLVDEVGAPDVTRPDWGRGKPRQSRIAKVRISTGHVFVYKPTTGVDGSAADT